MRIRTPLIRHQRPSNRVPHQRRHTDNRKHGSRPHANLPDIRYLRHESGGKGDKGAAAETVEGGEEDIRDVAAGGEPQAEDEDGAEEGGDDHNVEPAGLVGDVARDSAAKDRDYSVFIRM